MSLIDGSESSPNDPLAVFRANILRECRDANITNETLAAKAKTASYTEGTELGHLAEFWLLLSLVEVVSHPRETFAHHYAGVFREKAKQCDDASGDLFRTYGQHVFDILRSREGSSDQRTHVAATFAKRPYDTLAKQLEPVH